jgi:hypothetical protein
MRVSGAERKGRKEEAHLSTLNTVQNDDDTQQNTSEERRKQCFPPSQAERDEGGDLRPRTCGKGKRTEEVRIRMVALQQVQSHTYQRSRDH